MSEVVRDPVHGARYAFHPQGENMVVECWIESGGGLPEHLHPVQEERWSVVDGKIRFGLGNTKKVIGPEDGEMVVRPGTKHSLSSVSEQDAHLRCLVLPAGHLEDFLTDSARAAREGLFMKGGIPRSLRGARWAAGFLKQHQDEVVMTFPPRFVQRALIATLAR
jgi:quercetin dioxygenase-like cupin family protein